MNENDFQEAIVKMGISRAELCKRLEIAPNTGTAYALGRAKIPRYIDLAIGMLMLGAPTRQSRR